MWVRRAAAYDWGVSDVIYLLLTLAVFALLALLAGVLDRGRSR
ncbi:hypothetical protein GCM10027062_21410 [Nocardioides hungaricus]